MSKVCILITTFSNNAEPLQGIYVMLQDKLKPAQASINFFFFSHQKS